MSEPEKPGLTLEAVQSKAVEIAQQPGAGQLLAAAQEAGNSVVATYRRSGFKSSEFAGTLLVVLIAAGVLAVQLYRGQIDATGAAFYLGAVLKAMSYTAGRSAVKAAEAKAAGS